MDTKVSIRKRLNGGMMEENSMRNRAIKNCSSIICFKIV
jgi:hypothetical protein